jgi:predicted nucleic acid-binding Zn ribbon protein
VKRLERIGIVLPEVLEDLGVAKRLEEFKAVAQWEKVAGRKIAERSQAVDVQNKTLIVEVENNVWMQELVLLKPQILKKLAKAAKGSPIKDIRFRLKRT